MSKAALMVKRSEAAVQPGRRRLAALGGAVALVFAAAILPASARGAPESFADLAAKVSSAVVNISASQTVANRSTTAPNLPRGTPFDDLFEEFFRRRGGEQPPPQQRRSNSLGSGFVIDGAGIVVTNNHVIADANEVTVIFTNGDKLKAEVVGRDAKIDIAVLRVKPEKPLNAVKFGDSNKIRVGDWVLAVGNPFGLGGTVTAGIVSARNRNINSGPYDDYIQTDASINKGNSGGPLFNMEGEVVGVNTAILSPTGGSVGIGFASPAATIVPVIEQLIKYGETRRGWLGVRIQEVTSEIAESLGLGKARGALIAGIDDKGPSKAAGILTGDVIIKFDGRDVRNSADLPRIVASTPVGKDVDVVVVRKGKEQSITVKLGRLEDGEKPQPAAATKDERSKDDVVRKALGMEFSSIDDNARKRFGIAASVKGVVITTVSPSSAAAEKGLKPGDVIVEINQEAMREAGDVARKMLAVKNSGRKSALFLVANGKGEVKFVALPVE